MKRVSLTTLLMFVTLIVSAQTYQKNGDVVFPPDGEGRPRVTENTKIVYVDKEPQSYGSNLVMACTYFYDGIAAYKDPASKKWGLIDTLGNVVKEPTFISEVGRPVPRFINGHAFIKAPQGQQGYHMIDKTGKIIKKLSNISKISSFNMEDGYAGVLYYGSYYTGAKYGYIDFNGNEKFAAASGVSKNTDLPEAYGFTNGLTPYLDQTTRLWGYFNKQGKIAIKAQYKKADEFSDGVAAVFDGAKWGFIDTTGAVVLDFKYSKQPSKFNHNRATVIRTTDNKKCIIDKTGNILNEYHQIIDFNENGIALIKRKVPNMNKQQTVMINTDFEDVKNFGEIPMFSISSKQATLYDYDTFFVLNPSGWTASYVTDRNLNVIFSAYSIDEFQDGLAFILFDEPGKPRQSAFVNPKGEIVILFKYNEF